MAQVRRQERVGSETEAWAFGTFGDELRAAADSIGSRAGLAADAQNDWILLHWLLLDRELSGGGTPAQRYTALPELSGADREIAACIADARPGIHRVLACDPGRGLLLEDVLRGGRVRVHSATISRTAVVWDVLVARVMTNADHASLWGPTAVFSFGEEEELVDEFARLSAGKDPEGAWRGCWRDLVTFSPASRDQPVEVLSVEGDTLVAGHAAWEILDDEAVFEQLDDPLEYVGEGEDRADVFEWLIPRTEALARRPLRDGAVCLEATLPEHPGMVTVATLRLYADGLVLSTYSERRLDLAVELVTQQLRGLGRLVERDISPLDADLAPTPAHLAPGEVEMYLTEWLDTPLERLAGLTPRAAATRAEHAELERLVRGIENRAARARARGERWPQVDFVRSELTLGEHVQRAA